MGKKLDLDTMLKIVNLRSRNYNLHNEEIAEKLGVSGTSVSRVLSSYTYVINHQGDEYKALSAEKRRCMDGQIETWCEHLGVDPDLFIDKPEPEPDPEPEEPEQMSFDDFVGDLNSGAEKLLKQILHFVINVDKTLTALAKDERIIKALEVIANEK